MNQQQTTNDSLSDIEHRQNEVLRQLEELNQRVEQALASLSSTPPRGASHRLSE